MDPQLLAALLGPEGMMAMSQPPVVPPAPAPPMIAPPPALAQAPAAMPPPMTMAPNEAYRSEPIGIPVSAAPTSFGAALEPAGVPLPQARPTSAPGPAPVAPVGGDALLNSLKGVKAPEAPTAQKVSTPHAPQLAKIQGGALFDLLASLGIGPQQALPGLKLPSTLGQALGGR